MPIKYDNAAKMAKYISKKMAKYKSTNYYT